MNKRSPRNRKSFDSNQEELFGEFSSYSPINSARNSASASPREFHNFNEAPVLQKVYFRRWRRKLFKTLLQSRNFYRDEYLNIKTTSKTSIMKKEPANPVKNTKRVVFSSVVNHHDIKSENFVSKPEVTPTPTPPTPPRPTRSSFKNDKVAVAPPSLHQQWKSLHDEIVSEQKRLEALLKSKKTAEEVSIELSDDEEFSLPPKRNRR